MKNIINLVVEEELHGKRIDVVIAKKNDTLSRTRIKNLIINGSLSINDKIVNDILENIKSLQLSPSVLEELVQKHYVENKKIISLEGNLLRLAIDNKISRDEFIKFYIGNEINPNLKNFLNTNDAWKKFFQKNKDEFKNIRDRLIVVGILILFSLIFWALFEQAGSSLNILTDRGVDRVIFGWEVPASMFQSLNAGFIFTIAPLFALLWIALAKRNMEPSTPIKFSIGIVFVGLGFLALVYGMKSSEGLQTGVFWIILIYLLHTLGELCLSPVGLSSVTKLSPQRIVGFMMGMWFFASAAGNYVAGLIARATASESSGEASDVFNLAQKQAFMDVYTDVGIIAIGCGIFLAIITPLLKKLMHGAN